MTMFNSFIHSPMLPLSIKWIAFILLLLMGCKALMLAAIKHKWYLKKGEEKEYQESIDFISGSIVVLKILIFIFIFSL